MSDQVTCSWCDRAIEREDGWRLYEQPGARLAAFCRLEHVVPWELQGAHWEAMPAGDEPEATGTGICALCGEPLRDVTLTLVRHRGEHRIPDGFCSVAHLAAWARAGGRYA